MLKGHTAQMDDATKQVLKSGTILPSLSTASRRAAWRSLWHQCLYRFITTVYFERITLIHPERLPRAGPALYLGLHRNGAVDAFVYDRVLRRPVFMISTQLRRNWFARLFFTGIAVTRAKDEGDRSRNGLALSQCLDLLRAAGHLFVCPEGTSSLGPRHLPFKHGALWLVLDYLDRGGPPLQVVPVGIHYECPWAFRAKVEVVVGPPISTDLPPEGIRRERLNTLKGRMQAALEEAGINVPSDDYQQLIQRLAYAATLGTARSYFQSLKAMEKAVPEKIMQQWRALEQESREANLWFHQGVPLFPTGPVVFYLVALLAVGPIVIAALALNLPPFVAAWYAGRKFPDDRNVISLWKILVGAPAFALWIAVVVVTMMLLGKFWWLGAYLAFTCAGLKLYYRCKKLAVAGHNALWRQGLRKVALALRQSLLQSLPHETA